jgi:transcription initiation factor TFIIIB Brf1 subunit/transcription initiation factor TFIIB
MFHEANHKSPSVEYRMNTTQKAPRAYAALEAEVRDLRAKSEQIEKQLAVMKAGAPRRTERQAHADALAPLLEARGTMTIREVADALSVPQKTANRVARLLAHQLRAELMFEPHGKVDRLRLWHPSLVHKEPTH